MTANGHSQRVPSHSQSLGTAVNGRFQRVPSQSHAPTSHDAVIVNVGNGVNGVNGVNGRENYKRKGERYLTEGRLTITGIKPGLVTSTCRGSGEIYDVSAKPDGWRCSCPSRGACAHIHAAALVALKPRRST